MNVKKININQTEPTYNIASEIYDVTANNNGATFESLQSLLSSDNLSTLIPTTVRCGGMTILFIQSSDNKYVQYRLVATSFSTDENYWEEVGGAASAKISELTSEVEDIKNEVYEYSKAFSGAHQGDDSTLRWSAPFSVSASHKYRLVFSPKTWDIPSSITGQVFAIFAHNGSSITTLYSISKAQFNGLPDYVDIETRVDTTSIFILLAASSTTLLKFDALDMASRNSVIRNIREDLDETTSIANEGKEVVDEYFKTPIELLSGTRENGFFNNGANNTTFQPEVYQHDRYTIEGENKIYVSCTDVGSLYDGVDIINADGTAALIKSAEDTGNSFVDLEIDVSLYPNAKYAIINCRNTATTSVKTIGQSNFKQLTSEDRIVRVANNSGATIALPNKLYCVEKTSLPIYCENIIENGWLKDNHFEIDGKDFNEESFEVFANTPSLLSSHLKLINANNIVVADKDITTKFVASTAAGNFKICVIGDSKTDNAQKLSELVRLCANDSYLSVTFAGTETDSRFDSQGVVRTTKNCGFSGMNIAEFCCLPKLMANTKINPCYDSNVSSGISVTYYNANSSVAETHEIKFSIAKLIESCGEAFDILWIDHGANQKTSEWSEIKKCYDYILGDVSAYNSAHGTHIKIVISVQEMLGLRKPLYGTHSLVQKEFSIMPSDYIEAYQGKENNGVFICPQYLYLDLYNDFPMVEAPLSPMNKVLDKFVFDNLHPGLNVDSYNATKTYKRGSVVTNNDNIGYMCLKDGVIDITPNDDKVNWAKTLETGSGYFKIGLAYYHTLKYLASL